ncbi:hypothetical protein PVAP13_1NG121132 [Panicum virgatum]|uniref:Uncharacterized protein n=1 Tax=Panicum virgatum TaxID=38727 RepID=A0A8T0WPZ5_PANVG|nr:hypothetical protein PVAP13_1NG121132 [Panicum virgatum]
MWAHYPKKPTKSTKSASGFGAHTYQGDHRRKPGPRRARPRPAGPWLARPGPNLLWRFAEAVGRSVATAIRACNRLNAQNRHAKCHHVSGWSGIFLGASPLPQVSSRL